MTGFFFSGAGHFLSYSDKIKPAYARQVCAACLSFTKPFFLVSAVVLRSFLAWAQALAWKPRLLIFDCRKNLKQPFFGFQ
jgi:hypothetical protein